MGSWEAKVYFDDRLETTIIVKNSTSLSQIRNILNINNNNNEHYYFLNKNNIVINNDYNYTAGDIWKNDGYNEYRIDLTKYKNYDGKNININLNDFKQSAIIFEHNMSLDEIKSLGGNIIDKDINFFLTRDNTLIENNNNFSAKDVVKQENNELKIYLVTREFYKKIQIIDHLEKLSKIAGPIDWLKQDEFFKNIRDFASEEIANVIIDDILSTIGTDIKGDDKRYIQDFLKLLARRNNNYKNFENNSYHNNDADTDSDNEDY